MTEPSALTLKFKIFQKVEIIDLCSERLILIYLRFFKHGLEIYIFICTHTHNKILNPMKYSIIISLKIK